MDILTHPRVRITLPGGYRGSVDLPSTADTDLPVPDGCLLMMHTQDADEPYCALKKSDNLETKVQGNCAWVKSHVGEDLIPLRFHKVWSIEDDPDLVMFREKRLGDERRAHENQSESP